MPDGEQDYGSVGLAPALGGQRALSLQIPVTTTGASTTVRLGCRFYGTDVDDTLAEAGIWGAKIFAVQVASIMQQ